MGYWVYVVAIDDDEEYQSIAVSSHTEGGTYAIGGTDAAEMSVTYNYGPIYHQYGFSLKQLNEKNAQDALNIIEPVAANLPNAPDNDYWKSSEGNAGHVLHIIKGWLEQALAEYPNERTRVLVH